jgi:geranylgeranyl reductase family protein
VSGEHDVIVVGGGPAGSTCAYRLAALGARVLLLDRARFPRDKPCGGGLTLKGVAEFPVPLDPVVEAVCETVELRSATGARVRHGSGAPLVLMTRRRRLDAYLLDHAADAGVDVREGVRVRELLMGRERAGVLTDAGPERARVVIAADGANGVGAGTFGPPRFTVALEADVPGPVGPAHEGRTLLFEIGNVPGGYGWLFPKGDHANVGVWGWRAEGPHLRDHLRRLCLALDIDPDRLEGVRGHRIPLRRPGDRMALGRVAAIGDAAGLADPLSGDGISEAVTSARIAAEHTAAVLDGRASDLAGYEEAAAARLARRTALAWWSKLVLERAPRLAFRIAGSRAGGRLMLSDIRGGHMPLRFPPGLVRGLDRLAQGRLTG